MSIIKDNATIYGKWMMHLTWILGLAMATFFFQESIENRLNPNKNLSTDKSAALILKQNSQGHYIADGYINDHRVVFLLDTGATNVTVSKELARQLKLPITGRTQVSTANGKVEVNLTTLNSVSLGNITINNVSAFINPHSEDNTVLLGMSFLKNLTLIQKGTNLTILADQ